MVPFGMVGCRQYIVEHWQCAVNHCRGEVKRDGATAKRSRIGHCDVLARHSAVRRCVGKAVRSRAKAKRSNVRLGQGMRSEAESCEGLVPQCLVAARRCYALALLSVVMLRHGSAMYSRGSVERRAGLAMRSESLRWRCNNVTHDW